MRIVVDFLVFGNMLQQNRQKNYDTPLDVIKTFASDSENVISEITSPFFSNCVYFLMLKNNTSDRHERVLKDRSDNFGN